jgi:hypothetical protein
MALLVLVLIAVLYVWPIIAAHSIGKRKNREGWLWGVCLGWIGVLIIALRAPRSPQRPAQGLEPASQLQPALERVPADYETRSSRQLIATAGWEASVGRPRAVSALHLAIDKAVIDRDESSLRAVRDTADRLAAIGPAFINSAPSFAAVSGRATREAERLESTRSPQPAEAHQQPQLVVSNGTNEGRAATAPLASEGTVEGAAPAEVPSKTASTGHASSDADWYRAQLQRATERHVEGEIETDEFSRIHNHERQHASGIDPSHGGEAARRRAASHVQRQQEIREWKATSGGLPSDPRTFEQADG